MARLLFLWCFPGPLVALVLAGCAPPQVEQESDTPRITPRIVTQPVQHDTDDPAIWINPEDPAKSLIIGTDKDEDGALYVFDLEGRIVQTVPGLRRPNNVDVAYGLMLGGEPTDIAAATERYTNKIRIFRLPGMEPVDGGGIPVFEGEAQRAPMGIALYKRPSDGAVFAIVGRKTGPTEGYLWQYRLQDDGTGTVAAEKVRSFGTWSGGGEIEAIAVDDALGYVYYADEAAGVRKYHADPDAPGAQQELALFGTEGFTEDREGISIYAVEDGTGYILVSDQQAGAFHVYTREGAPESPHDHRLVDVLRVSTAASDGSEVTSAALGEAFPNGLFVAMSEDKTFQLYAWPDLAGDELTVAPGGVQRSAGL